MNEKHDNQTGSYELIRKRLEKQGQVLSEKIMLLNNEREKTFGKTSADIIARINVRTENKCVPRDMVHVGDFMLFGYNVFIGLKTQVQVADVFSLYRLTQEGDNYQVESHPLDQTFLNDERFVKDFSELYQYYKNTTLAHLRVTHDKLLAIFQIGDKSSDIRVFRWQLTQNGEIRYIDNRGERDVELPPAYDFDWEVAERQHIIQGKIPRISIYDQLFIGLDEGKLIFRLENNTEIGKRIHQENLADTHQSLDDLSVYFSQVGTLILLRVTPYNEKETRAYIFDTRTLALIRVDALDSACIQLPEDHGIIFPGGYYLTGGDYKLYNDNVDGLKYKRKLHSPNGEDVLFVFYEENEGRFALYSYNLIKKEIDTPLFAHGYSLQENGKMLIFRAESDEPTRIHPMQLWETPYVSETFYDQQPQQEGFLATIGNAELVRAIAELNFILRMIDNQSPNTTIYEDLVKTAQQIDDSYHWLTAKEVGDFGENLKKISETSTLVLVEFEKVKVAQNQAQKAVDEARQQFDSMKRHIELSDYESPENFVTDLLTLKRQKGHVLSLREQRYIEADSLDNLDRDIVQTVEALGRKAVSFLSGEQAMQTYEDKVEALYQKITTTEIASELVPITEELATQTAGLDALTDVINSLQIEDTTQKTAILESVSKVYGRINQAKAHAKLTKKTLSSSESVAEFSAQLAVLSQSVSSALAMLDSPEDCDEHSSRLLVQVEELASRFSEQEKFLTDIFSKRDEIIVAFETEKQRLNDERQQRAQSLMSAAKRILESIERRSLQFTDNESLNTYFSADSMVLKMAELSQQLRDLNDPIKADDLDAQFKNIREQAIRSLRDKSDIFENDGKVIKLGKHKFSVNTQQPDLTLLPRDNQQVLHLTGTDFYQVIEDENLNALSDYWSQTLLSETNDIYRAEYLAYQVLDHALKLEESDELALEKLVKDYADSHYRDGYEKGVHDHDAIKILRALRPAYERAGLMRFSPSARALAWLFVNFSQEGLHYQQRAKSAIALRNDLGSSEGVESLVEVLSSEIGNFAESQILTFADLLVAEQSARYLIEHWGTKLDASFVLSETTQRISRQLDDKLLSKTNNHLRETVATLPLNEALRLTHQWVKASNPDIDELERRFMITASVFWLLKEQLSFDVTSINLEVSVTELLGDHRKLQDRQLNLSLDAFLEKLHNYKALHLPAFSNYQKIRKSVVEKAKKNIDINAFSTRPLSTFVRNKLISESYLHLIGDNLAKQMGALGAEKRSDLMGLLLLISPPGYGKTTLMEYVANRLGLNFMKINCPSLGHDVTSLDPETAKNSTARQELERLNLALEMGNNVMLYLDDIQHTHPEFLQKFISLCDGTRRVDGVWLGESKTYNLRGKRFCIIMAGNPYTESGEVFKIPDMLANRADVYNLGDILTGQENIFELSYLENALTSNPTLAPLALRDLQDIYHFIDMAEGKEVQISELGHDYSAGERDDIISVLQKLFTIRNIVLKVNRAYIDSAGMDDQYRQVPPFKLQGSYRNMNKLAEKIVPIMDEEELLTLINDHYEGEAQLLTTGAEENILAYKKISGTLSESEARRLQQIEQAFKANNAVKHDDASTRIAKQIAQLNEQLVQSLSLLTQNNQADESLERIEKAITALKLDVDVNNEPLPGLSDVMQALVDTLKTGLLPIAVAMSREIDTDAEVLRRVTDIHEKVLRVSQRVKHCN